MVRQQVLVGFLKVVPMPNLVGLTHFVHCLDLVVVLGWDRQHLGGFLDKECIVSTPGRVGLWLEQGIKVPKGRLDPIVDGHLLEAHLHKNLAELGSGCEQRVQLTTTGPFGDHQEIVRHGWCRQLNHRYRVSPWSNRLHSWHALERRVHSCLS